MSPPLNDPINVLFNYVRLLDRVTFLTLDSLEAKLRAQQPFDNRNVETWRDINRVVFDTDNFEAQNALTQLNDKYKELVGPQSVRVGHPIFGDGPSSDWRKFTAVDFSGNTIPPQNRPIHVSNREIMLDYDRLASVSDDKSLQSFFFGGEYWTVLMPDPRTRVVVGREYLLDSLLLPRFYLSYLGFFPDSSSLTLHTRIRFENPGPLPLTGDQQLHGFSVTPSKREGLVPLLVRSTDLADGGAIFDLNPAITAANTATILAELITLTRVLYQAGLTMDLSSWATLEVDLNTGNVFFSSVARPILLDANAHKDAMDEQSWFHLRSVKITGGGSFTPDLFAYETQNRDIIASQELLLGVIDMLAARSGASSSGEYIEASHAFIKTFLLYDSDGSKILTGLMKKYPDSFLEMIRYYKKTLGSDGLGLFFQAIIPQVVLKIFQKSDPQAIDPQIWIDEAKTLINEANANAGESALRYWMDNYDRLSGYGRVMTFRRGNGNGGSTPQDPPPVDGGEMEGSPVGGSVGQASPNESTVGGLFYPDETTTHLTIPPQVLSAAMIAVSANRLSVMNPANNVFTSGQTVYPKPITMAPVLYSAQVLTYSP